MEHTLLQLIDTIIRIILTIIIAPITIAITVLIIALIIVLIPLTTVAHISIMGLEKILQEVSNLKWKRKTY